MQGPGPAAPPGSKDAHASTASIHSSLGFLSGVSLDLLEEENTAESLNEDDSEWDDDKRQKCAMHLATSLAFMLPCLLLP